MIWTFTTKKHSKLEFYFVYLMFFVDSRHISYNEWIFHSSFIRSRYYCLWILDRHKLTCELISFFHFHKHFQLNYSKIKFNFFLLFTFAVLNSLQIISISRFGIFSFFFSKPRECCGKCQVHKKERITSNMCGYFLIFPQYPHDNTKNKDEKAKKKMNTDKT